MDRSAMAGTESRLHHLDAARALFLLLGIPFHVATTAIMILSPEAPGFREDPVIGFSLSAIHSFRMFAFFMLSGFFAAMMRERKGRSSWLADRWVRIGVPLAVSVASLAVIQHHLKVGLSELWAGGFHGLPLAFEHLWFLIVLLMFVTSYSILPVRWKLPSDRLRRALCLEGMGGAALLGVLALWGAALAAIVYLFELQDNEAFFEHQLTIRYMQYAPGFLLGAMAWHWRVGARMFNLPLRAHLLTTAGLLAVHLWLEPMFRPALGLPMEIDPPLRLLDGAVMQPLGLLLSLLAFRLLARVANRPSRAIAFLVEGAMAIYLFHMTWAMVTVTLLARFLPGAPLPVAQWLAASALVLAMSTLCFLLVRRQPLLALAFCGTRLARPAAGREATA
ncbi:acyltransferase family protein [Novosphingobium cyanobacteriorum]|uniref:Acyltransferase family protein n=1 Tax=Novosphingobium cyanobacteriorum TaxID=3024215 RepID=A0ABT6CLM9_9SPHN|nr:acyltransferase family protein [Novosphingobium cyanobacteriorum]MDF8334822.1 acyltransferase family protein [Novosphingobium cyanobacteriorum]